MTRVTCRLTAKNRDQFWNPTLGNRVWATFTFFNGVLKPNLLNPNQPTSRRTRFTSRSGTTGLDCIDYVQATAHYLRLQSLKPRSQHVNWTSRPMQLRDAFKRVGVTTRYPQNGRRHSHRNTFSEIKSLVPFVCREQTLSDCQHFVLAATGDATRTTRLRS